MNVAALATRRYTTKAFDASKKIPAELMAQLETVLRNAPSSVNSQPWHFFVVSSPEGKERLTVSTKPLSDYNTPKVRNASHVVVLCARQSLDTAHLEAVLEQEDRDGRFATPEAKEGQRKSRGFYATMHDEKKHDLQPWMDRQLYIALGMLLMSAAALDIDACAIEGFDPGALDAELGLAAQGLRSVVMVALGYRSDEDFNAALPKSRLLPETVISHL